MIVWDFEYNDRKVILCCAENTRTKEVFVFDLRRDTTKFLQWVDEMILNREIFASYAIDAEFNSLLRLGHSTHEIRCIDLMAECRMISMSNKDYFVPEANLVGHLRVFLGREVTETKLTKDRMRDLIIYNDNWSDESWEEIETYCLTDIEPLNELFEKVKAIQLSAGFPYRLSQCLKRGEYVRLCSEMDFKSKGFPVDINAIEKIYGNKNFIKKQIIRNLPPMWQMCFLPKKGGGFVLSRKEIQKVILKNKWSWKLTENGLPVLKSDYLETLEQQYPKVKMLRQAQKSLATMNSADLRTQIKDGYIKPRTCAFAAKTGRNGLKPKQGYLLNLPSWIRKIIKPHKGMVLVSVDWSQQEIAIAAALSGDKKLIDAYNSGDIYLALGKLSGNIPEDGTKVTYRVQRELFKTLQLALGYGKGVKSLAKDFMGIMVDDNITEIESQLLAKSIYDWHKLTFTAYWSWIEGKVREAKLDGWIKSEDDWVCFVGNNSLKTQLLNFPSQSNGAAMMRMATEEFYRLFILGEIPELLCSQHDGFYFNVPEDQVDSVIPKLIKVMETVSFNLIGLKVRADYKVYDAQNGYQSAHMTTDQLKLWDSIMAVDDLI